MGLMNSMRNRGGLLVGVIAFAIVAFLAGDVLISGQNIFGGAPSEIGLINGNKVAIADFQTKLDANIEQYKKSTGQSNLNESMTGYLVDQTWNQVVYDEVMKEHIAKSNIKVSPEELFDMVQGSNPHPEVRRAFSNPQTGAFDPAQVLNFLKNMDQQDPSGETRAQWLNFEKAIQDERVRQKYMNAVKAGMYVPTAFAKADYMEKNKSANATFVMLDYTSVSDSAVTVSESDISNYYNANKYKYKQAENTRSFDYVSIDVTPSKEDTIETKKWIDEQTAGLVSSTNDSSYVNLNAETKYNGAYAKKGELPASLDTIMFSKPQGFVYGPFIDAGSYKVAKLIGIKSLPDSVRARHILINGNSAEAAKKTADSLKTLIDNGANFAVLAMQYSTDGSKDQGGDLGYFDNKKMVQPFTEFCFKGTKGKIGVVQSQFGFHIIEITDQKNFNKQITVGVIDRSITPSNSTTQALFGKANTLLSSISSAKEFEALKLTDGFSKRVADDIKQTDRFVAGIESPRELIRWAYKADVDDISPLFEAGNKYVFARLTKVKNAGTVPMEYLKSELEAGARKEKKVALLKDKMTAAMAGNVRIDQVAQKLGTIANPATGLSFAMPIIPGVAREASVVGTVFGSEKGKLIGPLEGERGVYLVYVDNFVDALPLPDYTNNKIDQFNMSKSRVDNEFLEGLKKSAKIVDNRIIFY
jgi:peptidyl-prolyl cis-trans isomerase D